MPYFLRFPKRYLSRHRSANLRGNLIRKYGKCILTGWTSPLEYQAAHIVPRHVGYALKFPRVNHDTNCILLSNSLHTIFDDMGWSFDMMNITPEDDDAFKTKIVIRPNYPVKNSILSFFYRKKFTIPSVYIPSLYLHYMVFKDLQDADVDDTITELYKKHIDGETYNEIKTLSAQEYIDYLQKKSQ